MSKKICRYEDLKDVLREMSVEEGFYDAEELPCEVYSDGSGMKVWSWYVDIPAVGLRIREGKWYEYYEYDNIVELSADWAGVAIYDIDEAAPENCLTFDNGELTAIIRNYLSSIGKMSVQGNAICVINYFTEKELMHDESREPAEIMDFKTFTRKEKASCENIAN